MIDLSGQPEELAWKILIVDDEVSVHTVTEMVLGDFVFEGKPLQFLHAHSATEAIDFFQQEADIALVLLDVVMESDRAGLDLVDRIRNEIGNNRVRIILRTGQPGQAPEEEVIVRYDINGYKEKTELTAQKLFTTVYSALRSYRDIMIIERNKRGLEKVIESTAFIFGHENSRDFASAVLEQVASLLRMDNGVLYARPVNGHNGDISFDVGAATGDFARYLPAANSEPLPQEMTAMLSESHRRKETIYRDNHCVLHFTDTGEKESLLFIGQTYELSDWEQQLVELFCTNVSIALENVRLNTELRDSQKEIVHILAEAIESRSLETGNHVRRVAKLAYMLGIHYGMSETEAGMLEMASPLHDLGKIGIPDAILNKPGRHDAEERRIMETHAEIGHTILCKSNRPIIRMGATLCRDHHENWDGSGYPRGLQGDQISLAGRIVAIADVFDALGSQRCYKDPWPPDEIRAFFIEQRGVKFEPKLVDILFQHWDGAMSLREQFPDEGDVINA
ncbi:MAG: DUF3369 domain-containing protein [Pseudomonadota bacterium]